MTKIHLHADDFGFTKNITDEILECIDAGAINGVSIIINGYAVPYSLDELTKRPWVSISLHLNLTRGRPLSDPVEIPDLVTKAGFFKNDFLQWLLLNYSQSFAVKARIKNQIQRELRLQIERILPYLKSTCKPLRLDTERNIGLIPIVFDSIIELSKDFKISTYRLIDTELIYPICSQPKRYLPKNIFKYFVLNFLVRTHNMFEKLASSGIKYNRCFFGVQFSGNLRSENIDYILTKKIGQPEVEISCHPGRAQEDELADLAAQDAYSKYLQASTHYLEKCEILKWYGTSNISPKEFRQLDSQGDF